MSSDLRPLNTDASSTASQMSASRWTNDTVTRGITPVPLPTNLMTRARSPHDVALPTITLSSRSAQSSDPRAAAVYSFPMDDPEGPRCLSLPFSRVSEQPQQRPKHQQNNDLPPYNSCSSSCDNLSLFMPYKAVGGSGATGRLIKASSDNPVYGSCASPPIPPRDYIPRASSRPTALDQKQLKPEIHPIVQDGHKCSNTHYWLLPDKQKTSASLDDVDKMADEQHYINIAGNGLWARKFGVSKAASFGHKKPASAGKEETGRNHHASEGTDTGGQRSVFDSDTVPLLSDVSSLDSMSVNIPASEFDVVGCPLEDECATSMGEVREMIDTVQSKIDGVTTDESFTALATHRWNIQEAVEYLKVENLFRLGLASRERCRHTLEINNWNLDRAASDLLDLIGIGSCK